MFFQEFLLTVFIAARDKVTRIMSLSVSQVDFSTSLTLTSIFLPYSASFVFFFSIRFYVAAMTVIMRHCVSLDSTGVQSIRLCRK